MADPLRPGVAGGISRLDWLLSRYWDRLEVDFTFRGVDLLGLFQECRVRLLLNLVDNLPRATLTQEAMAQDDELVESILGDRDPDDMPTNPIRWSEFSPETEALYGVVDRLGDITSAVIASGGRKPPRIPALKRPITAWDRVTNARQEARHRALVARVLPNG